MDLNYNENLLWNWPLASSLIGHTRIACKVGLHVKRFCTQEIH